MNEKALRPMRETARISAYLTEVLPHKMALIGRLRIEGARDLSDETMRRAFENTVAPKCCFRRAQFLRDLGLITEELLAAPPSR